MNAARPAPVAGAAARLLLGLLLGLVLALGTCGAEELTLAGLRPGRDRLSRALALFGSNHTPAMPGASDLPLWADAHRPLFVRLEVGEDQVIQSVTVSSFGPATAGRTKLPLRADAAGKGLRLGDPLEKAIKLYGEPYFRGPSTEGRRELILLVHKFSAEKDEPQIFETSFDAATGRLVKMNLTFPYY